MSVFVLVLQIIGMWCLLSLLAAWCWTRRFGHLD